MNAECSKETVIDATVAHEQRTPNSVPKWPLLFDLRLPLTSKSCRVAAAWQD